MSDGFDEVYVDTRRQLRVVAESLIAGPQYRAAGTGPVDTQADAAGVDVGPWTQRTGPFWNAPFGAVYPLDPAHDVDALTSEITEFFQRGRKEL
jgi:hypothetical protein